MDAKVRITVGKKPMRKFITDIKCRSERAVNKALGHKANMGGNKTLGWVLPEGTIPDLVQEVSGKVKVLVGTVLGLGTVHRDQGLTSLGVGVLLMLC